MARGRVDLRPASFNQVVEEKGYRIYHYRAMPCFCLNVDTGQPDPNCQFCEYGWLYWGEEEIRGLITGVTDEKQYAEGGGFLLGSMQLTVNAAIILGYHDRIVHRDSTIAYSEAIIRGDEVSDRVRFPIVSVSRMVGPGGALYLEGDDYTVNYTGTGKEISWGENGPDAGRRYSIAYMMHPTWLVLSHTHLIRDTMVKWRRPEDTHERLPVQALCKLEHLCEG